MRTQGNNIRLIGHDSKTTPSEICVAGYAIGPRLLLPLLLRCGAGAIISASSAKRLDYSHQLGVLVCYFGYITSRNELLYNYSQSTAWGPIGGHWRPITRATIKHKNLRGWSCLISYVGPLPASQADSIDTWAFWQGMLKNHPQTTTPGAARGVPSLGHMASLWRHSKLQTLALTHSTPYYHTVHCTHVLGCK